MAKPAPASDPFSDANDAFIKSEHLEGRLLLVSPYDKGERESTLPGQTGKLYTFVETNTVVLDGEPDDMIDTVPLKLEGFQLSGSGITAQLLPKIASRGMVLGRLGKKPSQTKGFGDMWILQPPTESDRQVARDYLAANPVDAFDGA